MTPSAINVTTGIKYQNPTDPMTATSPYGKFGQRGTSLQKQLYSQFASPMRTNDMRSMAQGNANYNLGAQTARANSGLQWAGIGNNAYMERTNNQVANRNLGTSLLQALLGGYS
jgi:hypothetical protein